MATWTDLCYVRQTVCEEISEDFYEHFGREITDYFQNIDSEEISINTIFAYCLGIILRGDSLFSGDYKPTFNNFIKTFMDAYTTV